MICRCEILKRGTKRAHLLSIGTLSQAERPELSAVPGGDEDQTGLAPALLQPHSSHEAVGKAKNSSYHDIPDSSLSRLTLMSLDSAVYMPSLKV